MLLCLLGILGPCWLFLTLQVSGKSSPCGSGLPYLLCLSQPSINIRATSLTLSPLPQVHLFMFFLLQALATIKSGTSTVPLDTRQTLNKRKNEALWIHVLLLWGSPAN